MICMHIYICIHTHIQFYYLLFARYTAVCRRELVTGLMLQVFLSKMILNAVRLTLPYS